MTIRKVKPGGTNVLVLLRRMVLQVGELAAVAWLQKVVQPLLHQWQSGKSPGVQETLPPEQEVVLCIFPQPVRFIGRRLAAVQLWWPVRQRLEIYLTSAGKWVGVYHAPADWNTRVHVEQTDSLPKLYAWIDYRVARRFREELLTKAVQQLSRFLPPEEWGQCLE